MAVLLPSALLLPSLLSGPRGTAPPAPPPAVTALLPPTEPGAHMEEDCSAAGGLTSRPAEAGAARAPQRRPGGKRERPPTLPFPGKREVNVGKTPVKFNVCV